MTIRTTLLAASLILASGGAWAAAKTDLGSRARIHAEKHGLVLTPVDAKTKKYAAAPARMKAKAAEANEIHTFITLAEGADASALEALGVRIDGGRGKVVLASFPETLLEAVEALPEVASIRSQAPLTQKMDRVRALTGVDKVHQGLDLPRAFTGKGVVAGVVDGGMDPNHVNFLNADGTPRISNFTFFRPTQSGDYVQQTYGADYIPVIDTETSTTFHGTHTLGIMAGSYKGDIEVAEPAANGVDAEIKVAPCPYYGVAPEADLAVACGALNDYYVALGIEAILDYAWEKQMPSVINLSIGSNLGAHDGSSALSQYLDLASELDRVIFCVAAGNEGELAIALHKTFDESDKTLSTCIRPGVEVDDMKNLRYGQVYIYSNNEVQFDLQATVVNSSRGAVAMRMPMGATDGNMQYWVSSSAYVSNDTDVVSAQLAKWFTGYIGVGAEFDAATGRYYGVIDYMLWDNEEGNPTGNYIIGLQVDGKEGQRVDLYGDGSYCDFSAYGLDGFADGMTDGTISDVATGFNTISVGSYNSRSEWGAMDGWVYTYPTPLPEGEISRFSSYGSLPDGRVLPDLCAPGSTVISSTNEYYILENFLDNDVRQAYVEVGERGYSWQQCSGTSMSTPVVSGTVALMLEADPSLTYADVKQILRETAVKDEAVTGSDTPAQWGAGKLDTYAAVRKVVGQSSIIDINDNLGEQLYITPAGDRAVAVTMAGAASLDIRVFSTTGAQVIATQAAGQEAVVDLSNLPAGIYIVSVNGAHSRKIAVK